MPNATQIEALFGDYLDSNVRKGALLINGEWGSGKTQLTVNRLQPLAEARGFKTAYLSVAEIDSLDTFEANLFIASYHWLGKGRMKAVAEASIKAARHWGSKFGIPLDSLVAARNEYSSGSILFIDDLERAPVELRKRILYRLANLHELRNTKAVILADEAKITKSDPDYDTIKEKAVARTIEYQPTYDDVAKIAVQVVFSAAPKKEDITNRWALSRHLDESSFADLLSSALESGTCRNLRSAITATADACELFEHLTAIHPALDIAIARSLVHSCAAFIVELRGNRSRSSDLRTYVNASTDVQWFKFLNSGNPSRDYLTSFDSKFAQGKECEIIKSIAILDYLEKGTCDLRQLLQDILSIRPHDESVFAYKRLNRYRALSTSDFKHLVEEAVDDIASLKIRSFQLIAESAHTLFYLAGKNLLQVTPVELRIRYVECLNRLSEDYSQGMSDIQLDYDPSLAFETPQGELRVVIEHIQAKANQLAQERFRRAKLAEIDKLSTNPDAFVAALNSVDSQIARSSCLDVEDAHRIGNILSEILKTSETPHIAVYKVERAITNRYLNPGIGINFGSEVHFLDHLIKNTQPLVADQGNGLLEDALKSLRDALTKSAESLRSPT